MTVPIGSGGRPSIQTGAARLSELPATPVSSGSSSAAKLRQIRNPLPSLQGSIHIGNARAQNSNPLAAKQQATTPSAPYYEKCTLVASKNNAAQLQSMRCDAKLANYAYTRDEMQLPGHYKPADLLAFTAIQNMGIKMNNVLNARGAVVDAKSGLTAVIVVNEKDNTVSVIFGGTTSGKKVGADLMERSRPGMNFMTTLSQWGANILAGLGVEPRSYKQAVALVKNIQNQIDDSTLYKGYSLRTIGHSKGGGEAMYASMMQDKPVPVTAFCPAHLSKGLINNIKKEKLEKATDLISSYSPEGDPVSAMRGKLPDMPGIGKGFHFKGIADSNPVNIHDQFLTHVEHFCKKILSYSFK